MYSNSRKLKYFIVFAVFLALAVWKRRGIINYYKVFEYKASWGFYKLLGEKTGRNHFQYDKKEVFENAVFEQPMMIRELPEFPDIFFVAEKRGRILKTDLSGRHREVFVDLSEKIADEYYHGLHSFAFHPKDSVVAVSYSVYRKTRTANGTGVTQLFSYGRKGADTRRTALVYRHSLKDHFGGALEFDREGHLFISTGDFGSAMEDNVAQDPGSLGGKILRLKINGLSGEIPLDNPFLADKFAKKEIWATGFRNPFRMSFLENGKTLVVADVGQYDIEEIDIVKAGGNYGWNVKEGTRTYHNTKNKTNFTDPVYEYKHGIEGFSITGGLVYDGEKFPELRNKYIFGDFITGRVWSVDLSDKRPHAELLMKNAGGITSFYQTSSGEIFWTDFSTNKIYKLVNSP